MSDAKIENLVNKITQDSQAKAKALIDDAQQKAQQILKDKVAEANAQSAQMIESAKDEAKRTKDQIIVGKKLAIRDGKLLAKQKMIDDTFKMAVAKMKKMSAADYNKFLQAYLQKLSIVGDETLVLPKAFQATDLAAINAKLLESGAKGELTLDASGKEIDGGFILIRDGIENNNTFESLLDYYREELEVTVAQNLF